MFLVSGLANLSRKGAPVRLVSQWHETIEQAYEQATNLVLSGKAIRITELNDSGHIMVAELRYYEAEGPF